MKKQLFLLSTLAIFFGMNVMAKAEKNTIVIAQGAEAKTLDLHGTNDQPSSRVAIQIYDTLVKHDESMNILPGLAESWTQIDDLTTEFKLRKGVKFHNGNEFKAKDVKFTIERMQKSAQVKHIIEAINTIEIVDDYTIKIKTKTPFGPLLSHLAHTATGILNEEAVIKAGDSYGQNPVGTGPYMFSSWKVGDRITLKANPDYYLGKTPTENLVFKVIIEGTNRTIALETEEADISYDIDPIDKELVKKIKSLELIEVPSLSTTYLGFNTSKGALKNKKVRQAISYAINSEDIKDVVYQGAAEKANSPIGPSVFGYNPNAKGYEFNPKKAKQLLKEAGYENGLKLNLWINENTIRRDIAIIAQGQLKDVGIDVKIETLEWGTFIDGTARGEHEMFILGWVSVTGDADYGLNPLFNTSNQGSGGNRSFYSNPKVDELLKKARLSLNADERKKYYEELQVILQEEVPITTLVYPTQNVGIQKSIKGFKMSPAGHHKLFGVSKEK